MKLALWVRGLGVATALLTLLALGLSLLTGAVWAQSLAVGLALLTNRMALIVAALGIVALWPRRGRWAWIVALALAGIATLMSGPISNLINSNAPYIVGPVLVGALAAASMGLPRARGATPSGAPAR